MVFDSCLDDVPILSDVVSFIAYYTSRPCSFVNFKKVISDSSRKVKQQFSHRRMRFYVVNFEQNILLGPFQLYELSPYCEI